jgi:RsiW-degrading membrane proteinase PrsW (M82 family)
VSSTDDNRPSAGASWTEGATPPAMPPPGPPRVPSNDPLAPGRLVEANVKAVAPVAPLSIPPRFAVYCLAIVGGLGGVLAAVLQEMRSAGIVAIVLVAPAVEEACKPLAVMIMVDKRPYWLRSSWDVVLMCMLGALTFATVENILYIFVYNPDGGADYIAWRLLICTGMHMAASGIVGLGLARALKKRLTGRPFSMDQCLWFYIAAVILHGVYNASALVLTATGVLNF